MFEDKEQLKIEIEELKKILNLQFPIKTLKKRDLKIIKKVLEFEMENNKKIKLNQYYDSILTKINNPDPNGIISAFGYTYTLPNENEKLTKNLIICIKYKNSDEWVNIYEYTIEDQIDLESEKIGDLYKYENLLNSKYLQFKERNCIEGFINEDKDALNIFKRYLKQIIYPDLITEFEDKKNKGKI